MTLPNTFVHQLPYFLKRDVDKFFIAVAIRNFAIGMVLLFEPIYLFTFFEGSLSSTFLFYSAMYGLQAVLVVIGGKVISRIGSNWAIFISYFFYFGYYISLFLLPKSFIFVPLAIISIAIGMSLYWPAFFTDFVRFSSSDQRGKQVGIINLAVLFPSIIAPLAGGWMIVSFGYGALFAAVLLILLSSSIPLAYTKHTHEAYTDNYQKVWNKVFSKKNWKRNVAFASDGLEMVINSVMWPVFLFILAIGVSAIGAISSFSLFVVALFGLYTGRISDTKDRSWLLNVGSVMTSVAWIIKYFVVTPFDAFLSQAIYKISRMSAGTPFKTFFLEDAAKQGEGADEFLIVRDVVVAASKSLLFVILAIPFFIFPQIPLKITFFLAAILSLGFMFLSTLPKMKL